MPLSFRNHREVFLPLIRRYILLYFLPRTVLCKSNESEFRRISRHFATFRRKSAIFLTKRNIAELSSNFRKRYCLDTFEISKLYANVSAKIRTTIREDSRNFEGNVSKFRRMLQFFEAFFEVSKSAANFRG